MSNKWTNEQLMAIDTRGCNLLVAAAAGAGKTAVLVERIIRRITDNKSPVDIDKLLVVTFTNAAASEMRERIGDAISKALDKNPEYKRLQNQLTLLNKASITTIHSFCLEVIRNNFHKIDLDPSFRIGDETETVLLKQEAMEELFEDMYENQEVQEQFLSLVECYGGSKDDFALQDMVLNLYEFAKSSPWPEKWLNEAAEKYNINESFDFGKSDWAELILENTALEIEGCLSAMNNALEIIKSSSGLEPYIANFENDIKDIQCLLHCCSSWDKLHDELLDFKFGKLSSVKNGDKDAKDSVTKVRNKVKDKINAIKNKLFVWDGDSAKEQIKSLYPMMKCLVYLVIEFDKRYTMKKREKGIIDFNDIEHYCLDILTHADEYGNIMPSDAALEYMEKFEEILIDEYQDSNLVQEVLLENISRKDNPNRFMVGDVKQSIYRFRQAKPELFLDKYNRYSVFEGDKERKITLYKNFRSRMEVIEGTNYIFKKIMSKRIGELDYTDDERLNLGAEYPENMNFNGVCGGAVEVHLIEKALNDKYPSDVEEDSDEEVQEDDSEEILDNIQIEAKMVIKRIKSLMDRERPFTVYDKGCNGYRPLEYRDIVILLRATSKWSPVFLEELKSADIPAFADSGVGYFETTEIKTVISLLQIIDNPIQDIPLIAVLRSPIAFFTPEELIDIRLEEPDRPFYDALKKAALKDSNTGKKAKEFLENLRMWQNKSLYMSTDGLLWYLYMETGYFAYVGTIPGGTQRQANLRVLFERAKQYESTSYKGLFNFINFINRLKTSSGDMGSAKILGENENVVRIMSIHKSKGLEFPVVIVSGTGKKFNTQDEKRSILFHQGLGLGPDYVDYKRRIAYPSLMKEAIKRKIRIESLSEEMRVLYVAFTRAREKLIITGMVSSIEDSITNWSKGIKNGSAKLPEYKVLKAQSYLDWICPSIMFHKDSGELRSIAGLMEHNDLQNEASRWDIKIWRRSEAVSSESKNTKESFDILKELESLDLDASDSEFSEEIVRRLDYRYPYEKLSTLPAKLSVTELKRIANSQISDEDMSSMFGGAVLKKPAFLEGSLSLSPAEKGTILHLVMQHLDIKGDLSQMGIKHQMEMMVEKQLLTEIQYNSVDTGKIENFYKSPLGERMIKSEKLRREVPFHMEIKSTDIYKELPEKYSSEFIAVQGIIDCFFEENGEIVLLDYKTDYVNNGNINEIAEKYRVQIDCYAAALERITGKRVKEKYIYLFYNGQTIKM